MNKTNLTTLQRKIKLIALSSLFCGLSIISTNTLAENNANSAEQKAHNESSHEEANAGENQEAGGIALTNAQLSLANIKVTNLSLQAMTYTVYAPGEIKANDYTSYLVSPRVDSVVLKRHTSLGEHVEKGQTLVTLFSESVAEAQASYSVANAEWQRVQKLGRKTVGDKRYITAQTDYHADFGRLLAFGLTAQAIKSLTQKSNTLGQYTLNAITAGAVLSDNFRQGQRVNSGDTLIELADEKVLWVEARLAPTMKLSLPVGTTAQIKVGESSYMATVTQKAHAIDPQTRTRTVRLEVQNVDHQLHAGLFADVYFTFNTTEQVLAVPEAALMRGSDGDWQVFVEKNGKYTAQEVELGRAFNSADNSTSPTQQWREITGISVGTKVVTQGAFYVAAEIAKGGFDAHGH
jgi:membrane fusion protein, heavy metal efflux system